MTARRRKKREAPFTLELAMLHLSGLDWVEAHEYVARRQGIEMTSSEIKIFAIAAEYSYKLELIEAVRRGWIYV
jgi:hypothetical protein